MYKNAHIQTVALDFSRRREQEPSISRTFVRLNVLDYKKGQDKAISESVVISLVSRLRV